MKKRIKYIIGGIIAILVVYNSVYFRPLDEKLAEEKRVVFDAESFVDQLWRKELLEVYKSATDLTTLIDSLKQDPEGTFQKEAQALGIGNIGYFKVKVEGTVLRVNEDNVFLKAGEQMVEIETEFIFGNAVRDASGLIRINDYDETSNFNSISEAINKKIRKEVIPEFKAKVKQGDHLMVYGAIELNKAHLKLDQPEVIPVSIEIGS